MPTHFQGSNQQIAALDLFIKLTRASESILSKLFKPINDAGLTASQFGVLEALYHLGPMCQRDIASKILKSTGNLTMVIDNLEKRQLAQRVRDTKDRRMITVSLLPAGKALIESIFPSHVERLTQVFSVLSTEEAVQLNILLRKVGHHAANVSVYRQASTS